MAMVCSLCSHASRPELEQAILRGEPVRKIAGRFPGISRSAVSRHRRDHMTALLAKTEAEHANRLAAEVRGLIEEAHRLRRAAGADMVVQ